MSARTRFLPRPRMVKIRPWVKPHPRGKRGRGRTSGRNGRLDSNFYRRMSVMTTLFRAKVLCNFEVFNTIQMEAQNEDD
jgi:hypothetical protein